MQLTLLKEKQIFGKDRLKVMEKYGTKAALTDFAILLGGLENNITVNNSRDLKDRTGYYWTKTDDGSCDARVVNGSGSSDWRTVCRRDGGSRPALPFSSISNQSSNKVLDNGRIRVEYGEYPQYVVSRDEQSILEYLYDSNSLNSTGKTYTIDSRKYNEYNKEFSPKAWEEYEYNGRKFVRVIANFHFDDVFKLSNREMYKDGDAVWVEVSPIKWIVDEKEDIAISERIIVAGIQFNKKSNYKGDFSKTDMYNFLNNYLVKDIIPSRSNTLVNDNEIKQIKDKIKNIDLEIAKLKKEKRNFKEQLTSQQKIKKFKRDN